MIKAIKYSLISVFHKMGHREDTDMEFLQINIDIDFQQIEKNLEQRRRVKLSLLTMIFLLSLAAIIFSVVHDLRANRGKLPWPIVLPETFFRGILCVFTMVTPVTVGTRNPSKSCLVRRLHSSPPDQGCLCRD